MKICPSVQFLLHTTWPKVFNSKPKKMLVSGKHLKIAKVLSQIFHYLFFIFLVMSTISDLGF